MNKKRFSTYSIGVFVMIMNLLLPPPASLATPRTWVGATGNWFVAANWTPNDSWPTNGDDATITNGCVILTNTTAALSSLSISNATLVFTNATTNLEAKLLAGNVYVRSSGIVTHTLNTDTNSADGWGVDGRVYIECTNLTVASNGWINADGKGYYGGRNAWGGYNAPGYGPGSTPGSTYGPGGAGHGGAGGKGSATADAGGVPHTERRTRPRRRAAARPATQLVTEGTVAD